MLQLLLNKGSIAVVGAVMFFSSVLINYQPNQPYVINHKETVNTIIFNIKTKDSPAQVVIDKNTGQVKINWKDKRNQIEFNVEYGNEIAPQDREAVDQIMKNILEHTEKKKTISGKVKKWIKDFVNKKL